jgi:pyruvate/2-oxoglutarate dehydrogenase complex dihydrolipoamide dehydrogenase (E3) component
VTFTDPEIARVGLNEEDAKADGIDYELTVYGLEELDRAIADSANYGQVRILTEPGRDRILGATIIARHAGEMLPELVLAMKHNLGLNKLLGTIHAYPTWNEANKFAAGEWKKANKPERILRWAERYFRRSRGN